MRYIKGVTEPLTRLLKKYDINVVNRPLKALQQEFPIPKSRHPLASQSVVVYKIPCGSCSWNYIGETGRSFATRKKEHIRNVKTVSKGSRVANHAWSHNHVIDFNNTSIIDKGNFRIRKFLESWHTFITPDADNNSFQDNATYFLTKFLNHLFSPISLYSYYFYLAICSPNCYFIHLFLSV